MAIRIPGWDSVEAATRWHRSLEILGFVALGLLLLFEVLAYIYSNRRDELIGAEELTAAQERQRQEQEANRQRDAQIAEANRRAEQAKEAQNRATEQAAPRHLTEKQKEQMAAFLSAQPTGTFTIAANVTVSDARAYADEIAQLFRRLGWTVQVNDALITGTNTAGVWITVKDASEAPTAAVILQRAFAAAGIAVQGRLDPSLPSGRNEFSLTVSSK
jgi:hypothetical protein